MKPFYPVCALLALSLLGLVGCGGGGGNKSTPSASVLSSTVATTSPTGVSVVAEYTAGRLDTDIIVQGPLATTLPAGSVVEYHVYRNAFIGESLSGANATTLGKVLFNDHGNALGFFYYTPDPSDPTKLKQVQSIGVGSFSQAEPLVYHIKVLYKGSDGVYVEAEIGQSNQITPYK